MPMRKLFILTILLCLYAYDGVYAQSVSQWCLKTDQGQYIEMARVEMLAAVDGQAAFEVVVREGQGAVGVKSITFEQQESDYVAPADDQPIVVTETGPWCMITDRNDSIAMSRVAMLASADGSSQFEVVATDGANLVGVNTICCGRGQSNTSGGFKPITGGGGSTTDPNRYNPWCMITDKNDTIAMSRVQMLANVDMQNIVQSNLVGKDTNGYPVVNGLRSYFAGSSPSNLYTPTTPYKVTVVEQHAEPLYTLDGVTYARLHVLSSGADSPIGWLTLRKTNNHGWLITEGENFFTGSKKIQKEEL